jgi:hypothetical protein
MERLKEQCDQIINDVAKLASVRLQESGEAGGYVRRFGGAHRPAAASTPTLISLSKPLEDWQVRQLRELPYFGAKAKPEPERVDNLSRLYDAAENQTTGTRIQESQQPAKRQDSLSRFGI